jgi:hypothetical protein
VRASISGTTPPTASTAHGEVARCATRLTTSRPSMTAARTAGGGAPIAMTYRVSSARVPIRPTVGGTRSALASSSNASAMMATCSPDTLSM